ncbi:cytochrome P450 [Fennellomyces sp. T-0311]|nr:cytochrome P450 [Fennellomyces sp. T-0311]
MKHFADNAQKIIQIVEKRLLMPLFDNDRSTKTVLFALGTMGPTAYFILKYFIYHLYFHPLKRIPGPRTGWIPLFGNMPDIISQSANSIYKGWAAKYGGLVCFHGPLNNPRIMITDPQLLKQVLTTEHYNFAKSPTGVAIIKTIIGNGLFAAEGEVHRRQRKMLNPAFSTRELSDIIPLIFVPVFHLAQKWIEEIDVDQKNDESAGIIVSQGISYMTMDMIGLTGFGQQFHAVRYQGTDKVNNISRGYETIFDPDRSIIDLLGLVFPIFRYISTKRSQAIDKAVKEINEESGLIVQRCIARAKEKKGYAEKHLLATMIRQSDDAGSNGFTEEEMRIHSLTFLAAGHESTATTITWCLWLLAKHQDIQDALRAEIAPIFRQVNGSHKVFYENPFEVGFDGANIPSYADINSSRLLESVVRETLRLIPTVPLTTRVATKDVILKNHLIPKGTVIHLPLIINHHDKSVWGHDAEEFRPNRWDEEPGKKAGPYNFLPFLSGGRQCIGNRFAIMKIKVTLGIMLMKFQFFEKPGFQFTMQSNLTLRPTPNMTLLVKPINKH